MDNFLKMQKLPENVEIKSNKPLKQLDEIRKHIGSSHGASLVALTMIDPKNIGIDMNLSFLYEFDLFKFARCAVEAWDKCTAFKTWVRSYKYEDKFLENVNDIKLTDNLKPLNDDDFIKYKAVVDIEYNDQTLTYKVHTPKHKPRLLTCNFKNTFVSNELLQIAKKLE